VHLLGELIRGREIFGWPTWGMLIETIDKVDWIVSLCRNLLHRRSNLKQCKSCFYQREKGVHIKSSHEILLLKKKAWISVFKISSKMITLSWRIFAFFFFFLYSLIQEQMEFWVYKWNWRKILWRSREKNIYRWNLIIQLLQWQLRNPSETITR
jgi:hypothetical protein